MVAFDRAPPGAATDPLDWAALRFHPLGLFDLRRRLQKSVEKSVMERFRASFDAAEIAWFAAGLHVSQYDGKSHTQGICQHHLPKYNY